MKQHRRMSSAVAMGALAAMAGSALGQAPATGATGVSAGSAGAPQAGGVAPAATVPSDLPSAESLFQKHIAAVGGESALRAESSRLVRGTWTQRDGTRTAQASILIARAAPDKLYFKLEVAGNSVETWFDGQQGWERSGGEKARPMQPEALPEARRNADYFGEVNYKQRYSAMRTTERQIFNGRFAYVVAATGTDGQERTLFFDAESGFLIGVRTSRPGLLGSVDRTQSLGEYKPFGSVRHPTRQVTREGNTETIMEFTSIETNVSTLPAFAPPAEERSEAR